MVSRGHQSGATLIELVMTIVIISIAVAGVVGAFSVMVGRNADPLWQTRVVTLAQIYAGEILSKKFDNSAGQGGEPPYSGAACNIGPDSGETRATYNDVDDYNGTDDKPPRTADGSLGPEYKAYEVKVTVSCAGSQVGVANNQVKRIDIRVIAPGESPALFSLYRGNF